MLSRRTTKTGKTVAVARPAIMPHVSSSGGGDDLGSEDEVKVFKDEGEDEKRSSENLTEEKSSLIDLTESEVRVDEIKKFSLFFSSTLSYNRYRVVVTIEFYLCITQRVILLSLSFSLSFCLIVVCNVSSSLIHPLDRDSIRTSPLSACVCLQEKGSLAGGSYATTGKTSARSDLSPVFGESYLLYLSFLLSTLRNYTDDLPLPLQLSRASIR